MNILLITGFNRSVGSLSVKLVGGKTNLEGTVEVTYRGQTGVIADRNWGMEEANVVCKMLGFK